MAKLLVNNPANEQEVIEVGPGGGYFDESRVLWDERKHGDLPAIQLGGMVATDVAEPVLDDAGQPVLDADGNPVTRLAHRLSVDAALLAAANGRTEAAQAAQAAAAAAKAARKARLTANHASVNSVNELKAVVLDLLEACKDAGLI